MNLSHAFLGGFTDEVFRRCIILGIKRSQVVKSLYQGGLPGISWFIVQDPQICSYKVCQSVFNCSFEFSNIVAGAEQMGNIVNVVYNIFFGTIGDSLVTLGIIDKV